MSIEHTFDNAHDIPPKSDSYQVERARLKPHIWANIDFERAICDKDQAVALTGVDAPIIAGIRAGKQAFLLFDTRASSRYKSPFLLTSEDYHDSHARGYKGIRTHREVVVGRSHLQDRFDFDDEVAPEHFTILYDYDGQRLSIIDEGSDSGTFVSGFIAQNSFDAFEAKVDNKKSVGRAY